VAQKTKFFGKKSVNWALVERGVWVLRLWSGQQYPQIAILQFTPEAYQRVRMDLSGFLNGAGIFGKNVKVQHQSGPGAAMVEAEPLGVPAQPPVVVATHSRTSKSAWITLSSNEDFDAFDFQPHARGVMLPSL
jgi:hypothetical protein